METVASKKPGTFFRSIRFSLAVYWQERKSMLFLAGLSTLLRVLQPYLTILLPKLVIDQITSKATAEHFMLVAGGVAFLLVLAGYGKSRTDLIVNEAFGTIGIFHILWRQQQKRMTIDYALLEDPEVKDVYDKAYKAQYSNHSPAMNIPRMLVELLSNGMGFLLYTGLIATVHPLLLLLIFAGSAVNWWALSRARRYAEETRDVRSKLDSKLKAVQESMRDPAGAKDIRLYAAFPWLSGLMNRLLSERAKAEDQVGRRKMQAQIWDALMILLRDGAAYGFLIAQLLRGQLSLGDFVLVFAAIGALAGWISGILVAVSDLSKATVEMGDIIDYLEYPNRMNTGPGVHLPTGAALPPALSLENVGYTYPKAEKPTLEGITLDIRPGESLAIVGANGAGKTTLVKLLCGLYLPTEGEVRLNGQPVSAYNRDEYYRLFSPVFQDIHLMSGDIACNISQATPEETDLSKVRRCLKMTGLLEKVESLPDKEQTLLVRAVNPEATELSGGEKQKLAMARALYKDAPVIILDEPTAALDPIAENEVYQKYAELTKGKTSVYISHRLASTRFCDRIILLEGSRITEEGTHDELMRKGGAYAHMFEVQASYYQKEAAHEQ